MNRHHAAVAAALFLFAAIMIVIDALVPFAAQTPVPESLGREAAAAAVDLAGTFTAPEEFIISAYREAMKGTPYSFPFEAADGTDLARRYSRPVSEPRPGDIAFFQDEKGAVVRSALVLEASEGELKLIAPARPGEMASVSTIGSNRSDLHSIARPVLVRSFKK